MNKDVTSARVFRCDVECIRALLTDAIVITQLTVDVTARALTSPITQRIIPITNRAQTVCVTLVTVLYVAGRRAGTFLLGEAISAGVTFPVYVTSVTVLHRTIRFTTIRAI